jgi:prepilin-type processing-associated H-X9-DG protein/prepilin-type N-terminal cleavage/methylation domain-containing protein
MKRQPPRPMAFSLIEILVVLAIIGLVAAVLFPVFTRARADSRRITCVSNLRQLGTATFQYLQDSDEVFMPVAQKGDTPVFWSQELQPFLKNTQILECPEDDTRSMEDFKRSSYGYNSHLGGAWSPLPLPAKLDPGQKGLSQVVRPSSTVLMTDSGTVPMVGFPSDQWPTVSPCPQDIGDAAVTDSHRRPGSHQNGLLFAPRARHSDEANVLWVDGHVTTAAIRTFYVSPGVIAPGETVPGYSPCLRPESGCR